MPNQSELTPVLTKKLSKRSKGGAPCFYRVLGNLAGFGPPPIPLEWALGGRFCPQGSIPQGQKPHFEPKFRGGGGPKCPQGSQNRVLGRGGPPNNPPHSSVVHKGRGGQVSGVGASRCQVVGPGRSPPTDHLQKKVSIRGVGKFLLVFFFFKNIFLSNFGTPMLPQIACSVFVLVFALLVPPPLPV